MKNFRIIITLLALILMTNNCSDSKAKSNEIEFEKSSISEYEIENIETVGAKLIVGEMSDYTSLELEKSPWTKSLTINIIVPTTITKISLENTLKSIVEIKILEDDKIDEIEIFAYDNKNDIGESQSIYGELLWAPNGKKGMLTSDIVINKDRNNYKFDIVIKNKVGNINQSDIPAEKE